MNRLLFPFRLWLAGAAAPGGTAGLGDGSGRGWWSWERGGGREIENE